MKDKPDIAPICEQESHNSEAIARARAALPDETLLYDVSDFFKVFSDSTRMKILFSLDLGEMCVCDIAEVVGMTKSAVSHQLKTLRQEKLVTYRKEGKNVFYSLDDDHVKDIIEKGLEHITEE